MKCYQPSLALAVSLSSLSLSLLSLSLSFSNCHPVHLLFVYRCDHNVFTLVATCYSTCSFTRAPCKPHNVPCPQHTTCNSSIPKVELPYVFLRGFLSPSIHAPSGNHSDKAVLAKVELLWLLHCRCLGPSQATVILPILPPPVPYRTIFPSFSNIA